MASKEKKKNNSENNPDKEVKSTSSHVQKPAQNTIKDLICPFEIDINSLNHIKMVSSASRYVRTFFVNTLPRFLKFGEFLKPLYNFGNTNTSIFIKPISESMSQGNLNQIINDLEIELTKEFDPDNPNQSVFITQKKLEAENLRDEISTKFNHLFEITVISSIFAKTAEDLDRMSDTYGVEISKSMVNMKSFWAEHEAAFKSNLPYFKTKIYQNNIFDSFAASTVFPFWSLEVGHSSGTPLGNNLNNHKPIFVDDFYPLLRNYNFLVFGNEKSTKSSAIKLLILRSSTLNEIYNVVIDTTGTYKRLTASLDGELIKITAKSKYIFNPFEIDSEIIKDDITGKERPVLNLKEKIEEITNIIATMARGPIKSQYVNDTTKSIIRELVTEEYSSLGINNNPESLFGSQGANLIGGTKIARNKKTLPTIGSWYKRLCEKASQNNRVEYKYHFEFLIKYMKQFVRAQDGNITMFDGQSNIDLPSDKQIITFDLSGLDDGFLKPLTQHVLISWLSDKFVNSNSEDRARADMQRVIIDEAWPLLPFPEAINSLITLSKNSTRRNTTLIISSKNFPDFEVNFKLKSLLLDSSIKLLMRHDKLDLEFLRQAFNLSLGERDFLGECAKQEGILILDNASAQISITSNDTEISLI
ncbi:MAG: VirB4 family type IV secretion system protein [Ignavibacteriales bacterium]